MDESTYRILRDADDPENIYAPATFDQRTACGEIQMIKMDLDKLTKREFTLECNIQDATYFGSLSLLKREDDPFPHIATVFGIYFSSFGKLFSVASNSKTESLPSSEQSEIISLIASRGFQFVNDKELDEPYDGHNAAFSNMTWRQRFFDYL